MMKKLALALGLLAFGFVVDYGLLALAQTVVPVITTCIQGTKVIVSGSQIVSNVPRGVNLLYDITGYVDGGATLTFAVTNVDPQNPTVQGSSASSGPLSTSGNNIDGGIFLAANTGTVLVTWTMSDAGSFGGVYLTLSATGAWPGGSGGSGGGGGASWDAGVLIQNTLPILVDNSAQDAGVTCNTLCGTSGTLIACITGQRSATICNNGSNQICIGATPALSCPGAIDAGTTVGSVLVSGQCMDWGGGINAYCVAAPGQSQIAPDAGTVTIGGH